jgi:hypothetical protein
VLVDDGVAQNAVEPPQDGVAVAQLREALDRSRKGVLNEILGLGATLEPGSRELDELIAIGE